MGEMFDFFESVWHDTFGIGDQVSFLLIDGFLDTFDVGVICVGGLSYDEVEENDSEYEDHEEPKEPEYYDVASIFHVFDTVYYGEVAH